MQYGDLNQALRQNKDIRGVQWWNWIESGVWLIITYKYFLAFKVVIENVNIRGQRRIKRTFCIFLVTFLKSKLIPKLKSYVNQKISKNVRTLFPRLRLKTTGSLFHSDSYPKPALWRSKLLCCESFLGGSCAETEAPASTGVSAPAAVAQRSDSHAVKPEINFSLHWYLDFSLTDCGDSHSTKPHIDSWSPLTLN